MAAWASRGLVLGLRLMLLLLLLLRRDLVQLVVEQPRRSHESEVSQPGRTHRLGEDALGPVRDGELAHVQQLLAHHAEELLRLGEIRVQVPDARRECGVVSRLGRVVRGHWRRLVASERLQDVSGRRWLLTSSVYGGG